MLFVFDSDSLPRCYTCDLVCTATYSRYPHLRSVREMDVTPLVCVFAKQSESCMQCAVRHSREAERVMDAHNGSFLCIVASFILI